MSQTQPDARLMRCYKGQLTDEGVECQAFRSEAGELFTLIGDLEGYTNGDKVVVCGSVLPLA